MTDLLMTTWDGSGTTPPLMSVARALVERGHSLRVLADPVAAARGGGDRRRARQLDARATP